MRTLPDRQTFLPISCRRCVGSVPRDPPPDDMMYELHLLRICMAIKQGFITITDAIEAEPAINQ